MIQGNSSLQKPSNSPDDRYKCEPLECAAPEVDTMQLVKRVGLEDRHFLAVQHQIHFRVNENQ